MLRSNKILANVKALLLALGLMLMVNLANASSDKLGQLKMVGQGQMSWLFMDVYQATFYSQTGKYQEKSYPQALKIMYQRDITKDDLVNATEKQWQKLALDVSEYQQWLKRLDKLWPDIQKGDELTFLVENNGSGFFYHNNQLLGGINNAQFSNNFLSIWLSKNTTEPKLRKQLIGE